MNATPENPDESDATDAPAAGTPGATAEPRITLHRLEFRGTGAEYFRIWIVNLALSILTLGIYSAWAKVRRLKWFYGCTVIDGTAFQYHGDPIRILKGRAIAAVLLAIYLGAEYVFPGAQALVALAGAVVVPWLVVRSRMFTLKMSSWRGLRFDFRRDYAGAYTSFLGWGVLSLLSAGLLYPRFDQKRYEFVVTRSSYAGVPFEIETRVWPFYRAYLTGLAVVLATAAALVVAWNLGLRPIAGAIRVGLAPWAVTILMIATLVIGLTLARAVVTARALNEVYNSTRLGPHRLESDLSGEGLFWLYAGNALLIVFTLGLYIPFAQVKLAQFRAEATALLASGSLDDFVAARSAASPGAAGEEISDLLDVDFGL